MYVDRGGRHIGKVVVAGMRAVHLQKAEDPVSLSRSAPVCLDRLVRMLTAKARPWWITHNLVVVMAGAQSSPVSHRTAHENH